MPIIAAATVFLSAIAAFGQIFSHPLSLSAVSENRPAAVGTINVLAIMVQFQADTDSLTSGDGQFDLSTGSGLDAPPHNKKYFENHLTFLKNYFYKVSGGKLNINFTVLDSVVTLPHQMKYYSPPRNATMRNVGLMFQDAWHIADSLYRNFDFSQYQCFVIFHAGSGRDIDFTSTLGYNPRPYDIPSIYLSPKGLQNIFGQNYNGVEVDNGKFLIDNSIIMPEDEFYQIYDAGGSLQVDLKLGTNGLLASSFGSFLGLPDLFDSQTGITGIGRFGLMDGQAIFAYGGIFPPEPSAWEKIYLGWVEPVTVSSAIPTTVILHANETSSYNVVKVPVSGSEYFLLENRERDANHDGLKLTTYFQGKTSIQTITNDTTNFDGVQVKGINGVVTDADEYDWALPGGQYNGKIYNGGILIWHIDENVINKNLASNTVNADPFHRGVALMEAHGALEIGKLITTLTGFYYYDGSPFDFWFNGNPAVMYINQFSPISHPNSNSYSGANSHVYIYGFSSSDSLMTCTVRIGDTLVVPMAGFPKYIAGAVRSSSPEFVRIGSSARVGLIANNGKSLYAYYSDGSSLTSDSTGLLSKTGGAFQPVISASSGATTIFAADDSILYCFSTKSLSVNGALDTLFTSPIPFTITSPLHLLGSRILAAAFDRSTGAIFSADGRLDTLFYLPVSTPLSVIGQNATSAVFNTNLGNYAAIDSMTFIALGQSAVRVSINSGQTQFLSGVSADPIISVSYGTLLPYKLPYEIFLHKYSVSIRYDSAGSVEKTIFNTPPGETITSGPVIADIEGNGSRDILFATETKIYALNYTGAVEIGFPIYIPLLPNAPLNADSIVGNIAIADLNGDGKPEVVFGTADGSLHAVTSGTNRDLPGFPLSIGGGLSSSPALGIDDQGRLCLAAIGMDGYLYGWRFGLASVNSILWGNLFGDTGHSNSNVEPLVNGTTPPVASLMPPDRVYNWPNPATNGWTKIRFYLRENASVYISVFDFAGDKVADFSTEGFGGIDNEITWNTANVQSGIYFARVRAQSANETATSIVKIAVVK
ncbi:MAG: T9SS type A sorting domain-containing protein [Candidatus Kryptoniota bacterium]